ncbi:hypothetical protein K0M31_007292 [Melipona bicolor]|uniref:Uncharacterized protein n=1 Tax=Melipona bicolor TaxID=60889 RepID=A0AA40GCG5_9HYME|nr:hypothetical protein K0M31_007292 [Melipona bicolor]
MQKRQPKGIIPPTVGVQPGYRENVVARIISIFTTLLFGQASRGEQKERERERDHSNPPSLDDIDELRPRWLVSVLGVAGSARGRKSYTECFYQERRELLSRGCPPVLRRLAEKDQASSAQLSSARVGGGVVSGSWKCKPRWFDNAPVEELQ